MLRNQDWVQKKDAKAFHVLCVQYFKKFKLVKGGCPEVGTSSTQSRQIHLLDICKDTKSFLS